MCLNKKGGQIKYNGMCLHVKTSIEKTRQNKPSQTYYYKVFNSTTLAGRSVQVPATSLQYAAY